MERELYEKLRASDWSVEIGDDDAEDENILQPALASDACTGVAKQVVNEIRTVLDEMEHGFGLQDCSVCFTVCGQKAVDHYSGSRCPQFPLGTRAQIPTGYMVKTLRSQSTCDSNMPSDQMLSTF